MTEGDDILSRPLSGPSEHSPQPDEAKPATGVRHRRPRRRMSTGNLLFLVLTVALAPVGAIAFGASARTILTSDSERNMLLQVVVSEKADRLASLLNADAARLAQSLTIARKADAPPVATEPGVFADTTAGPETPAAPQSEFAPACDAAASAFPGGADRASAQVVDRTTGADVCVSGVPPLPSAIGLPLGTFGLCKGLSEFLELGADSFPMRDYRGSC